MNVEVAVFESGLLHVRILRNVLLALYVRVATRAFGFRAARCSTEVDGLGTAGSSPVGSAKGPLAQR